MFLRMSLSSIIKSPMLIGASLVLLNYISCLMFHCAAIIANIIFDFQFICGIMYNYESVI